MSGRAGGFGILACSLLLAMMAAGGCSPEPQFRSNQLEWFKQERMARFEPAEHFAEVHRQDVADVMTAWFGTPDEPFLPLLEGPDDPLTELLSIENLRLAAGPVKSLDPERNAGLYRRHCAHCHGVTGDGAGPTASFLAPYPRDFRLGRFKFKSTPTGTPPTKDDLKRILREGIPGTSMPSFRLLSDEELEALTDYTIYLSIRGLVERLLIEAVRDMDDQERLVQLPPGRRLSEVRGKATGSSRGVEPAAEESEKEVPNVAAVVEFDEDQLEEDLLYLADDHVTPVVGRWLGTLNFRPKELMVPNWVIDSQDSQYEAKVELGQKLYFGAANCLQCHGETGIGDGQLNNFDDWTNDWLKVEGINPTDPHAWAPYVAAGALPPKPIPPRNLRLRIYRGGDQPIDIFRRIQYGIEGTPMPASLTLSDEEVWAVVAYVRQMPYEAISRPATAGRVTNEKTIR